MKQITRTVTETVIRVSEVSVENGAVVGKELAPVKVFDRAIPDGAAALKEVRKVYGNDKQFAIVEITKTTKVVGVNLDKFMELAVEVTRPESQQPAAKPTNPAEKPKNDSAFRQTGKA